MAEVNKKEFENYYYNMEKSDNGEMVMPYEMALELNLTAKQLDYIAKNFGALVGCFIDQTLCEDCFRELPAPVSEDLGGGYSQLVIYCQCGRSYTSRQWGYF